MDWTDDNRKKKESKNEEEIRKYFLVDNDFKTNSCYCYNFSRIENLIEQLYTEGKYHTV